jgi:hypothetical protein
MRLSYSDLSASYPACHSFRTCCLVCEGKGAPKAIMEGGVAAKAPPDSPSKNLRSSKPHEGTRDQGECVGTP